jgi:hypothetical protein
VSWVARDIRSIEQSQHWCIRRSQNSLAFELLETVNIHFVSGAPVKVDNLNGHASRQYQAINQSHKPNMINLYAMWHDTAPTVLYNCSIQKGLIMFRTTLHPSACQELESSVRIFSITTPERWNSTLKCVTIESETFGSLNMVTSAESLVRLIVPELRVLNTLNVSSAISSYMYDWIPTESIRPLRDVIRACSIPIRF